MNKFIIFAFRLLVFLPLFIVCQVKQIQASIDRISEKFSRNQSQFEESIAHLNFKFSDEAVAKLQSDFSKVSEIIQTRKQIREAKTHLRSLRANLADQNTVKKPSFMSVDVSALKLWWLEPLSKAERTDSKGFTLPSIKEWFLDRQRDWMLLGSEIMDTYDEFFKDNTPSPESFIKLIRSSIENLVFRGHFVWFDMEIPRLIVDDLSYLGKYAEYRKSFQNQTIDKEEYLAQLREQVFYILFEGRYKEGIEEFNYEKFSVRTYNRYEPGTKQEDLRLTRFQTELNYFPLLQEDSMMALFEVDTRKEAVERSIEKLENLGKKGFSLSFSEESADRSFSVTSKNTKPHTHKVPEEQYQAIERIFKNCYLKRTFKDAKELKTSFNLKFDPEDSPLEYYKERTILPVFASESYSFQHRDSYCQIIGPIFRYIYLENELELYKKHISTSGDFYDRATELRKEAESLSERLKEAKKQLFELEKLYQEELDKDKGFFSIKVPFFRTDSNKLKFIQSQIDTQNEKIQFIENRKASAVKNWGRYKPYHYSGWFLRLENVKAEEKALSDQLKKMEALLSRLEAASKAPRVWITSIYPLEGIGALMEDTKEDINSIKREIKEKEDLISFLFNKNYWKWGIAKRRVETLENLLPRFQAEYEEAKGQLASLSLEEDYKKIQTEWMQATTSFFEWLEQQFQQQQEYERAAALKKELPVFIRKVRGQLKGFRSHLTNLEAEKIFVSSFRKKHLELKLKVISDLNGKRQPRLQDVFHAFLLEHYGRSNPDTYEEFLSDFNNLSEIEEPIPIDSFKEIYETKIANVYHRGQPLLYNRRAFRLTQPLLRNQVQCYSGSLLFYMLTELAGLTDTPRFALFTKGHVLPGVLSDDDNELWGIESTAEGKGIVNFGSVPEVSGNIRVVEMYPFLLIELLKSEISNFPELYAESQNSLRKYGFSIEKLYPLDQEQSQHIKKDSSVPLVQTDSGSPDVLNATPFVFGSVNVPPGDRKRGKITEESLTFYDLNGGSESSSDDMSEGGDFSFGDLREEGLLFSTSELPDFLKQPAEQTHLNEKENLIISNSLLDIYQSLGDLIKQTKYEGVACSLLVETCLYKIKSVRMSDAEEYSLCWNAVEDQTHQLYRRDLVDLSFQNQIMECMDSGYDIYYGRDFLLYYFSFREFFKNKKEPFLF